MLILMVKVKKENVMNGSGHPSVWMRRIAKTSLNLFYQMMDDIDTGKVKTYPVENVLKRLEDLVDMGG